MPSLRVERFFNRRLSHAKDQFAGKPFTFEPWQRDELVIPIYDSLVWRGSDLIREVTEALIGIAKKNGKTQTAAGLGAYGLYADGHWHLEGDLEGDHEWSWIPQVGAEVYNVAGSKEQAKLLFEVASGFVLRDPWLSSISKVYRDAIEVPETESVWRVLAADARLAHGPNPSTAIIDEIWNHKDPELYEAFASAGAARRQPLLIVITTAGFDQKSVAYKLYQRGKKNRSRKFHFRWWEAPAGAALTDKAAFRAANPSRWVTWKYDQGELARARSIGNEQQFDRWHRNRWTGAKELAIPMEVWLRGAGRPRIPLGESVVMAVDSAPSKDSTAVAVAYRDANGVVHVIVAKMAPDPETGYLDYEVLEELIREFARRYQVRRIFVDPYNMIASMTTLANEGLPIEKFPQQDNRMVPASQALYEVLMQGRIRHGGVLQEEIQAAAKRITEYGWRLAKRTSSGVIDGLVAMAIAVYELEREEPPTPAKKPRIYV